MYYVIKYDKKLDKTYVIEYSRDKLIKDLESGTLPADMESYIEKAPKSNPADFDGLLLIIKGEIVTPTKHITVGLP